MRWGPLPSCDPRAARPDRACRPSRHRLAPCPVALIPPCRPSRSTGSTSSSSIGKGGFSYVFSARQKDFNRRVALKVLTFGLVDERERRSFERECRAMGLVSQHPHIVTVFNAAFTATKQPVIVMELYSGGTMGDRQKREGRLPVAVVLDTGVKIAGALQTAHDRGLLHRDIKPQNLFISEFGEPALGDFGISTLDDERSISGGGGLTVHYAPPEVWRGPRPRRSPTSIRSPPPCTPCSRGPGRSRRPAGRDSRSASWPAGSCSNRRRGRSATTATRAQRAARPHDEQVAGRAPGVGGRVRPGVAADPGRARPAGDGAPTRRATADGGARADCPRAGPGARHQSRRPSPLPPPAPAGPVAEPRDDVPVAIRPVGADDDSDGEGHTITVGRPVVRPTRSSHQPARRRSEASTRRIVIGTAAGVVCLLAVAASLFVFGRGGGDGSETTLPGPTTTQVVGLPPATPQGVTVVRGPGRRTGRGRRQAVGEPDSGITYQVRQENPSGPAMNTDALSVTIDGVAPAERPCFVVIAISRRPDSNESDLVCLP